MSPFIRTPESHMPKEGQYLDHWHFHSHPRPQQEEVLCELDELDASIILCNAPTGVGKSAINVAIANKDSGIILTPQRILQDQIGRDWPNIPILKGSANYSCGQWSGADCQQGQATKCKLETCEYRLNRRRFLHSRISVTNYAYFFAALRGEGFDPLHHWIIGDEAHELESALINAAEVRVSLKTAKMVDYVGNWPSDAETAYQYAEGMIAPVDMKLAALRQTVAPDGRLITDPSKVKQLITLENLSRGLTLYLQSAINGEEWIFTESDEEGTVAFSLRPLYAKELFQTLVAPLGKRVFLTSATLPPVKQTAKWLGIDPDECYRMDLPSPFALENRQLYFWPTAFMDMHNREAGLPVMAKRISSILGSSTYRECKGIIHTHSFHFASSLARLLMRAHGPRLLVHEASSDREKLLAEHLQSPAPTVLISPSMTEGLDLKDDLSRFTIFMKVPFPHMTDPWIKRRMEDDSEWYTWQALKSIMQGCGRSVRHEDDWAHAFMLDSSFAKFWQRCQGLVPEWFARSVTFM